MTTPKFPFATVDSVTKWFNFHHTIANRSVPLYCTIDNTPSTTTGSQPNSWRRQAQGLNAIIDYCMKAAPPERLTAIGAKWSLGNVLSPDKVLVDPANMNTILRVDDAKITDAYRAESAGRKGVPVIVQGGSTMRNLNSVLGSWNLSIQTSGANDGHLFAGCVATGTHGSALNIGAVHDSILAMVLITGPNQAVLLQPTQRRFTAELAAWYQNASDLKVADICDDDLFYAAQVAIGGLGFVHSAIIEAVPLYQLTNTLLARPLMDQDVWDAIDTLDTSKLYPANPTTPYHFSVVLSPYAKGNEMGAFPTLMWKQDPPSGLKYTAPNATSAMLPSDTSRLLSWFMGKFGNAVTGPALRDLVVLLTAQQFKAGTQAAEFSGHVFGPTNLPAGNGRSTEFALAQKDASAAIKVILAALQQQARDHGRFLLGALGVRFVKKTNALLGMNIHDKTCYIEVPSLGSDDLTAIQQAVWTAMKNSGISYTCHWGQEYGMDHSTVVNYYGNDRITRWQNARNKLLTTPEARAVFTTPILSSVGIV